MPRLVAMYLFDVTRLTVDSCILIASATVLRLSGRRCWTPCTRKRVLLAHDLLGDAQDRAGPLVEALDQPVGGLQALDQEFAIAVTRRHVARDACIVGTVDQDARQRLAVDLDQPAAVARGPDEDVGDDRSALASRRSTLPGLGLSVRISAIMSVRSSMSASTDPAQLAQIVRGEKIEVVEEASRSSDRSGRAP